VLIDSRSGISELAAPTTLALGATVLLFGTAQRHTIDGYRSLFAGLRLLAQRDGAAGKSADWRLRLKSVFAKAGLDAHTAERHRDELYELFSEQIYDAEADGDVGEIPIAFARDDTSAPHWPLVIPFSPTFADFEPSMQSEQLTRPYYEQVFGPFLEGIHQLVERVPENEA